MISNKLIAITFSLIFLVLVTLINQLFDFADNDYSKVGIEIDTERPEKNSLKNNTIEKINCLSGLYVSDVTNNQTDGLDLSLKNLFQYYSESGVSKNDILTILKSSSLIDVESIEYASILFEPPIYLEEKTDLKQVKANFEVIEQFGQNYEQLTTAIENGDIPVDLNLSSVKNYPVSIIDYLINSKTDKLPFNTLKRLVDSGIVVSPETIFQALKSNISVDKLAYLFDQINSSKLNYRRNDVLSFNYDYISYAAIFSSPESLEFILSRVKTQHTNALNDLILSYTSESTNQNQSINSIEILNDLQKRNENFNKKFTLLLNYNAPIEKHIATKLLKAKSILNNSNQQLLSVYENYSLSDTPIFVNKALERDVLNYLEALTLAHQSWPEFIFSYDPNCSKVPSNSHYRYDNLREKSEIIKYLRVTNNNKNKLLTDPPHQLEDIYIDLLLYNQEKIIANNNPDQRQNNASHSANKDKTLASIMSKIALKNWDKIEEIIAEDNHILSTEFRKNTYLFNIGIEFNVPQDILFSWFDLGAKMHESALPLLISNENYAELTYELIKRKHLKNISHKSIIFQVAKAENLRLLTLLVDDKSLIEKNTGLSALSWTILNYNKKLADQLKLLKSRNNM